MVFKMNWRERIHTGFILAIAFFLVLASNRLNRRNFDTVEHTVNTVFKDRVVAQEYIYKLNNLFHGMELQLASGDEAAPLEGIHSDVKVLLDDYATTVLTVEEAQQFQALRQEHAQLEQLMGTDGAATAKGKAQLLQSIGDHLDKMARIQLFESRNLTQLSNKSLQMNQLISNLEIAFLIILGVLFLFVMLHRADTARLQGNDAP